VLGRLDEFLLYRVFQPVADAMAGVVTPAEAARCCVTGAMVFVLAKMLAAGVPAVPHWTVLVDLLALWAGMVVLGSLTDAPAGGRLNPLSGQFALARPILAVVTALTLLLGVRSLAQGFTVMQTTLWCLTLYFGSCTPPQKARVGRPSRR